MVAFKVVISAKGKSYNYTVQDDMVDVFIGKKVGDEIDGATLNLNGYTFKISGGSDKEGFPMTKGVTGGRRLRILLTKGIGFHPTVKGMRKKKSIRGNTIFQDISQINLKVVKYGDKSIEDLLKKEDNQK